MGQKYIEYQRNHASYVRNIDQVIDKQETPDVEKRRANLAIRMISLDTPHRKMAKYLVCRKRPMASS